MGWRYLFRLTKQSKIYTQSSDYSIAQVIEPGQIRLACGRIFKQHGQLLAQAKAIWSIGYDKPWRFVTNASPCTGLKYAQRHRLEQSFRDLKSLGLQWQDSQVRHPGHVDRLLL